MSTLRYSEDGKAIEISRGTTHGEAPLTLAMDRNDGRSGISIALSPTVIQWLRQALDGLEGENRKRDTFIGSFTIKGPHRYFQSQCGPNTIWTEHRTWLNKLEFMPTLVIGDPRSARDQHAIALTESCRHFITERFNDIARAEAWHEDQSDPAGTPPAETAKQESPADVAKSVSRSLQDYKAAFPTCKEHAPDGGFRASCPICALIEAHAAISRIDYILGEPNARGVSQFDESPLIDKTLSRIESRIASLRMATHQAPPPPAEKAEQWLYRIARAVGISDEQIASMGKDYTAEKAFRLIVKAKADAQKDAVIADAFRNVIVAVGKKC